MKKTSFISTVALTVLFFCGCTESDSADRKMKSAFSQAQQGNWSEASSNAAELAAEYPGAVAPQLLQALAYEKNGDLAKATDLARQCAVNAPGDFTAQYTLGRLYSLDPHRQTEAFSALEQALQLCPGDTNTLVLLCNIGVTGNYPETEKYLNYLKNTQAFQNSADVYFMLGMWYAGKKKFPAAKVAMRQAYNRCKTVEFVQQIIDCLTYYHAPREDIAIFNQIAKITRRHAR